MALWSIGPVFIGYHGVMTHAALIRNCLASFSIPVNFLIEPSNGWFTYQWHLAFSDNVVASSGKLWDSSGFQLTHPVPSLWMPVAFT